MRLLALWLATFAVSALSGPLPFIHSEVYLLSVAALVPRSYAAPLVVASTLGQVLGKGFVYWVGRGALTLRGERLQRAVAAAQRRLEQNPRAGGLILFASAAVGFPPMFAVSLACGAARMNFAAFVAILGVGRLIHTSVVVLIPRGAEFILG